MAAATAHGAWCFYARGNKHLFGRLIDFLFAVLGWTFDSAHFDPNRPYVPKHLCRIHGGHHGQAHSQKRCEEFRNYAAQMVGRRCTSYFR